MSNPFEVIEARLSNIESLILDIKHQPNKVDKEQTERFLNIKETAVFLNLSPATIYSKVSRRELPFMKRGKRLYFSKDELLDYVKNGRKRTEVGAEVYLSNNKKGC